MTITKIQKLFQRECLLSIRSPAELLHPLLFFVVIVSLFPLAISPDPQLLQQIGAGIIWMAVLFASILSFSQLFAEDYRDGSLEQFVLTVHPLSVLVLVKTAVHTIFLALPLIIVSPLLAFAYDLSLPAIGALILSLILAIPSLCLLGSIAASITLGLRNSSVLLALILLPLYVPILIFASTAVLHAQMNQSISAELALLGALLILLTMLAPWVTSYCLRVSVAS